MPFVPNSFLLLVAMAEPMRALRGPQTNVTSLRPSVRLFRNGASITQRWAGKVQALMSTCGAPSLEKLVLFVRCWLQRARPLLAQVILVESEETSLALQIEEASTVG